ncbi:hypothetical protein ANN_04067 [Periplaneta americana]|uniref:Uncharacterized protein n=1 Tax=Periplaneta americana TaxID=6978 RepID=A0ABQ8T7K2_PERAM|nr:hypothetical protein ANN_04067 [Periplaneta americana]
MIPGSTTESYPAFAHIGLRENPGKNLNQVTCPDRESNPGHLVSRLDVLTVTPQDTVRSKIICFTLDLKAFMVRQLLTPVGNEFQERIVSIVKDEENAEVLWRGRGYSASALTIHSDGQGSIPGQVVMEFVEGFGAVGPRILSGYLYADGTWLYLKRMGHLSALADQEGLGTWLYLGLRQDDPLPASDSRMPSGLLSDPIIINIYGAQRAKNVPKCTIRTRSGFCPRQTVAAAAVVVMEVVVVVVVVDLLDGDGGGGGGGYGDGCGNDGVGRLFSCGASFLKAILKLTSNSNMAPFMRQLGQKIMGWGGQFLSTFIA